MIDKFKHISILKFNKTWIANKIKTHLRLRGLNNTSEIVWGCWSIKSMSITSRQAENEKMVNMTKIILSKSVRIKLIVLIVKKIIQTFQNLAVRESVGTSIDWRRQSHGLWQNPYCDPNISSVVVAVLGYHWWRSFVIGQKGLQQEIWRHHNCNINSQEVFHVGEEMIFKSGEYGG